MVIKRRQAALIVLFFSLAVFCACSGNGAADYASVNGEIIKAEEITYFRSRCRTEIINEYAEKYGVEDFSDFWDRDFDGMTPAQSLEKRALNEAVSAKIRLVMMRENGIYDDISFAALSEKAEKFNSENKNASGVVGIKTVDMDSFYTYYISTGELALKNILAEGVLKPSEEELAAASENAPLSGREAWLSAVVSDKYDRLIAEKIADAAIEVY